MCGSWFSSFFPFLVCKHQKWIHRRRVLCVGRVKVMLLYPPVERVSGAQVPARVLCVPYKPTVCLDVIALVASCCGHYRGQIEQRAAHEFAVHVATLRRARETSTAPPAAARSARCVQAGAALQRSTAAPEAWHRSGTLSRSGTPRGRTREEKRPNRFTFLVMHRPPADAIFVSQPWPRYHWMLVRSS